MDVPATAVRAEAALIQELFSKEKGRISPTAARAPPKNGVRSKQQRGRGTF